MKYIPPFSLLQSNTPNINDNIIKTKKKKKKKIEIKKLAWMNFDQKVSVSE